MVFLWCVSENVNISFKVPWKGFVKSRFYSSLYVFVSGGNSNTAKQTIWINWNWNEMFNFLSAKCKRQNTQPVGFIRWRKVKWHSLHFLPVKTVHLVPVISKLVCVFLFICKPLSPLQSPSFLIYAFNHSAQCAALRESVCFLHQGVPPVWHCSWADGICDKDLQWICIPHLGTCTGVTLKPIDLTHTLALHCVLHLRARSKECLLRQKLASAYFTQQQIITLTLQ